MWSENGIKLRIVSLLGGWGGYGFFQNEFTLGTLDPFWSANLPRFAHEVYRPKRVLGTLGKFILKKIP